MRSGPDGERRRTFIEEARRGQIVQSAIETLAEVGYANASLARIAQHAEISKGVISYHFTGKDELLEQVMEYVFTTGAEHMMPSIVAAETPRAKLRAYIESNIEFIGAHMTECLAVAEIVLNMRGADGKLTYGLGTEQPVLEPLVQLLRAGQQAGEFRDFAPRIMAVTIRRAIDAVAEQIAHYQEPDAKTYARELADLFGRATTA